MLKPSLQLKLGQTLTMTPQLQQAIQLLQLPVLDLSAKIQDALEENIMLEMEDLPDVPRTDPETTVEIEVIKAEENWQATKRNESRTVAGMAKTVRSTSTRTGVARRSVNTSSGNSNSRISRLAKH